MMSAMRTLGASAIAERFCLLIGFAVKERHRHRVKILYLPSADERVAYRGYTMRQKLAQLIFSCRRRMITIPRHSLHRGFSRIVAGLIRSAPTAQGSEISCKVEQF